MYPFNRIWFWLLLISLILIITSIISFYFLGNIKNLQSTPFIITLEFIVGVIFLFISFIAFIVSLYGFHRKKKNNKYILRGNINDLYANNFKTECLNNKTKKTKTYSKQNSSKELEIDNKKKIKTICKVDKKYNKKIEDKNNNISEYNGETGSMIKKNNTTNYLKKDKLDEENKLEDTNIKYKKIDNLENENKINDLYDLEPVVNRYKSNKYKKINNLDELDNISDLDELNEIDENKDLKYKKRKELEDKYIYRNSNSKNKEINKDNFSKLEDISDDYISVV